MKKTNRLLITLAVITTLTRCNMATDKSNTMAKEEKQTNETVSPQDTTPKVTGIGGFSFFQIILKKQENGMPKIWG
jgi:hypothetical protein